MLKEFNRIAREMLFVQGHLTRPQDWAVAADTHPTGSGRRDEKKPTKRRREPRYAAASTFALVTPLRFVIGQLR